MAFFLPCQAAGALGARHSPRPFWAEQLISGRFARGNAEVCLGKETPHPNCIAIRPLPTRGEVTRKLRRTRLPPSPAPTNPSTTLSPALSHIVFTRLPVSTIWPGAQAFAVGGEMVGEPGQRVVRMAEHVGAGAAPDFVAVDDGAADDVEQIGRGGSRHRFAEHAAGGKEIVRHQSRRAHGLPFDVAVVDDLDRRQIGLDRLRDRVGRERRLRRRQIARRAGPRFRIRRRRGRNRLRAATRRWRERPWRTRRRRRDAECRDIAASPRWCSRSCSRPARRNRPPADRAARRWIR